MDFLDYLSNFKLDISCLSPIKIYQLYKICEKELISRGFDFIKFNGKDI